MKTKKHFTSLVLAQALASYQAPREQCPACELPESLEEAVEQELPAKKP